MLGQYYFIVSPSCVLIGFHFYISSPRKNGWVSILISCAVHGHYILSLTMTSCSVSGC